MTGFFKSKHHVIDPTWHVQLTMLVAISLQLVLPDKFLVGSRYIIPIIEVFLLIALSFTTPKAKIYKSSPRRVNAILLIIVTSLANGYALTIVTRELLIRGQSRFTGRELVLTAINIFLTNIIIFALWYWEMDGGGPGERLRIEKYEQDFLFPQHQHEPYRHPEWRPTFLDYLYVSSTNAMTFGPADTKPLSRRAKMLMLVQAAVSLIAIALVAARAISLLG